MKDEQIIFEIAHLDGLKDCRYDSGFGYAENTPKNGERFAGFTAGVSDEMPGHLLIKIPPYLTSRDAIVPVIEAQRQLNQFFIVNFWNALHKVFWGRDFVLGKDSELYYFACNHVHFMVFDSTPRQLCTALLKATEKWSGQ